MGESILQGPDGNLGLLRNYLATNGNLGVSKVGLSDFRYLLANPRLNRYFSTEESPKKKSKGFLGLLCVCFVGFGLGFKMVLFCRL